jgi:hypothetical protein
LVLILIMRMACSAQLLENVQASVTQPEDTSIPATSARISLTRRSSPPADPPGLRPLPASP